MEHLPQTYFRDSKTFRHELLKRTEPGTPNTIGQAEAPAPTETRTPNTET